ncbi:NAD(P)H-dependent oxidoreductase [Pendulispora rubella]|uniref:FMN dependent NADH:quinone oxidoreductase n=1 Tax=Pendulispora rubella TaxID=2741070 RepID=A0ABZ2L725_9BACT
MNLLHLDSSILGSSSVSRELSRSIVEGYRAGHPDLQVTYRDLARDPLPHIDGESQKREESLIDALIDELKAADVVVIGAPLYNFAIPSGLKAWIDHVLIAGKTFKYGPAGVEGLVPDKKTYVVATRGGVYEGSPVVQMHEGHLDTVLRFVGIRDIEFVRAEGLAMREVRETSLAAARAHVAALVPAAAQVAA